MDKYKVLQEYFGYSSFRGGQEYLIDAALSGRDVIGIMPTGGGKSLCYQIPAIMFPGVAIVISPLISLMKDQVMSLSEAGVSVAYLNSTQTLEEQRIVYNDLRMCKYKLLYIAPERLQTGSFLEIAKSLPISFVAVDEAHCISQWGNDFRPSYLQISDFIDSLSDRPIVMAFTATATERVRLDIEKKLKLSDPMRVITGFDRPNLKFTVETPTSKSRELIKIVKTRENKSGIVYCSTRKNVEKVCDMLKAEGILATRYHAGLSDSERRENQEDFVYDRKAVMVATNAFGMGIDKSNVSYVVHYDMPLSLEAYYQEAGRAGRDGEAAECILLYSPSDIYTAKSLIQSTDQNINLSTTEIDEIRKEDMNRLQQMIQYCKTTECLRTYILRYFGQESDSRCDNCGNCHSTFKSIDITLQSQKILSCIKRINDKVGYSFGAEMLKGVLRGGREAKLLKLGLDQISTYGIMRDISPAEISELIHILIDIGYIDKNEKYGSLTLSAKAKKVLFEGEKIVVTRKESVSKPKTKKEKTRQNACLGNMDGDLNEILRLNRARLAQERDVPAFVIFSNATLSDMASKKPVTISDFLTVSGVGASKAKLYGDSFVSLICDYVSQKKI